MPQESERERVGVILYIPLRYGTTTAAPMVCRGPATPRYSGWTPRCRSTSEARRRVERVRSHAFWRPDRSANPRMTATWPRTGWPPADLARPGRRLVQRLQHPAAVGIVNGRSIHERSSERVLPSVVVGRPRRAHGDDSRRRPAPRPSVRPPQSRRRAAPPRRRRSRSTVTRKMSQAEADKLTAAFANGGVAALRKALTGVAPTGLDPDRIGKGDAHQAHARAPDRQAAGC